MSKELIAVRHTTGDSQAFLMETDEKLTDTRKFLTEADFMKDGDFFVDGDSEINQPQEKLIPLSAIVKDDDNKQQKFIAIGVPSRLDDDDGVDRYNRMSDKEREEIFNNIEISRGLTVDKNGFAKGKELYTWPKGYLPDATMPRVVAEITKDMSFSKITHTLRLFGSESASVSFESPYASGEAEYEHEQSKTTSTEEVTEYLTAKFIVRKVKLEVDASKLRMNEEFLTAVKEAIKGHEDDVDGYSNLVGVLNTWGYYAPLTFYLGGVLYSTDTTKIKDFSQAETEKEEYGASFKAEFEGVGGGGGFKKVKGSEKEDTTSNKFQSITITQVGSGGVISTPDDYSDWAEGLKKAINWQLATAPKLYPSLMFLTTSKKPEEGAQLLGTCLNILDKFKNYPKVKDLQPYIDLGNYVTVIQTELNPWAED